MVSSGFEVPKKEGNEIMYKALPFSQNILTSNNVPEVMGKLNESEISSTIAIST